MKGEQVAGAYALYSDDGTLITEPTDPPQQARQGFISTTEIPRSRCILQDPKHCDFCVIGRQVSKVYPNHYYLELIGEYVYSIIN